MVVFRRDRGAHIGRFASHLSSQPIHSHCPLPSSLELLLKPAKRCEAMQNKKVEIWSMFVLSPN